MTYLSTYHHFHVWMLNPPSLYHWRYCPDCSRATSRTWGPVLKRSRAATAPVLWYPTVLTFGPAGLLGA